MSASRRPWSLVIVGWGFPHPPRLVEMMLVLPLAVLWPRVHRTTGSVSRLRSSEGDNFSRKLGRITQKAHLVEAVIAIGGIIVFLTSTSPGSACKAPVQAGPWKLRPKVKPACEHLGFGGLCGRPSGTEGFLEGGGDPVRYILPRINNRNPLSPFHRFGPVVSRCDGKMARSPAMRRKEDLAEEEIESGTLTLCAGSRDIRDVTGSTPVKSQQNDHTFEPTG